MQRLSLLQVYEEARKIAAGCIQGFVLLGPFCAATALLMLGQGDAARVAPSPQNVQCVRDNRLNRANVETSGALDVSDTARDVSDVFAASIDASGVVVTPRDASGVVALCMTESRPPAGREGTLPGADILLLEQRRQTGSEP